MAKHLLVTVTVFFLILALSHASIPLDLPENEVVVSDLAADLPESNAKTIDTSTRTIVLPSEKPETESEPETAAATKIEEIEPLKAEPEIETQEFQPLTVVNFRPLNRQFPRRPSLTLRHRRPCRQHHFGKPWEPTRFHQRQIPYGNDMLMSSSSSGEEKEVREIPARWVKFHHRDTSGPKFPFDDEGVAEDFKGLRHFHRHHRHHHHHHMEGEEKEEREEGHEHEPGFFVKIRKFLNHF